MYKIKFLDSLQWNREQTETKPLYKEQFFSDADLPEIAKLWKTIGIKRVESVEVVNGGKLTVQQVIDLFYPDVTVKANGERVELSEHDKNQKAKLLEMYKSKEGKEPAEEADTVRDEKAYRAELFAKFPEDKKPPKNTLTAKLEELVKQL